MTIKSYLCTKVLLSRGLLLDLPRGYGAVDVRPPGTETPDELEILKSSLQSWQEDADIRLNMRVVTVVEALTVDEAIYKATIRFEEALDMLYQEVRFAAPPRLSKAGIIRDLSLSDSRPILPTTTVNGGGLVFMRSDSWIEALTADRWLLSVPPSDVVDRLKRAAHWDRLAGIEENPVVQVLFRWFVIEGLCNIGKTEALSASRALLTVGVFSKGQSQRNQALVNQLQSDVPDYLMFSKQLKKDIEELKELRNGTVHDALRTIEVDPVRLKRLHIVTTVVASRVRQRLMRVNFEDRPKSMEKAWEQVEEQVVTDPDLVKHVANVKSLLESG